MNNKDFLPQIFYIESLFKKTGNPLGIKKSERSQWAKDLNIPKKGKRILFVGCMYPYLEKMENMLNISSRIGIERSASLASALSKIGLDKIFINTISGKEKESTERLKKIALVLKKLNIDFAYLDDEEPCCGEVLYNLGFHEQFKQHAINVMRHLEKLEVKEMIVLTPFCAYTFKELYKQINPEWNIKVKTLVEVLAENINNAKFSKNISVTYHDPCYYARHLNITNEPRKVLKSITGIQIKEPSHNSSNTKCIGDGGLELTYPKLADEVAKDRTKELINTGADIIVTQCPTCILMIKRGLQLLNVEKRVLDLGELVYESMITSEQQ